jgi:hypothetical protein
MVNNEQHGDNAPPCLMAHIFANILKMNHTHVGEQFRKFMKGKKAEREVKQVLDHAFSRLHSRVVLCPVVL